LTYRQPMRGSHTRHRTTFSVAETNGSSIPRKSWEEGPPQCRMIGIKPAATSKTSASEPSEAAQLPDTHKQRAPTRSVQSKALDTVKHRPSQPTIPHTSPNRTTHHPTYLCTPARRIGMIPRRQTPRGGG